MTHVDFSCTTIANNQLFDKLLIRILLRTNMYGYPVLINSRGESKEVTDYLVVKRGGVRF